MPSVTAEDPALKPARIAEGILPLRMKHGNFVISGAMWHKFNANRPWLTFAEFWLIKERAYNQRNEELKAFFLTIFLVMRSTVKFFTIVLFVVKSSAC